jgi:hypothetical protein
MGTSSSWVRGRGKGRLDLKGVVVEVGEHMQCLDKGIYGGEGRGETVAVFIHQRLFEWGVG